MLATKLLKHREKQNWFYRKTEPFFEGMNRIYSRSLNAFLRKRVIAIPFTLITLAIIGYLWGEIPAEMAPLEDRSQINIRTRAAEGASYEYIRDYTEEINMLVDSIVPDAAFVTARVSSGSGNIQVTLKDIKERDYTQMQVAEQISQAIRTHTKARSFVQQQSSFGGRRSSMPVQYVLQAVSIEKLQEVLPEFLAQVYDNPTFQMADVDLKFSSPEMRVHINRDKAGTMGVSVRDIGETLQYGLSGQRMGYFYMNGKQYEILGQINRQQRNQPANIKSIYIRSDKGEMIQLDNLVEFIEAVAPPKLYHYNRFISATISAGLAEGKTIGDGLDEMDKIAANVLDDTFRTALSGDSKEYRESSSSLMFAFILALVLIYLILSAQFESFKDPFIIMLTVEHFQSDWYHHADWSGSQERYFDCRVCQPKTRSRRRQDAGHPRCCPSAFTPHLDDQCFYHPGPASIGFCLGRRSQSAHCHGSSSSGWYAGIYLPDHVHCTCHLFVYFDKPC